MKLRKAIAYAYASSTHAAELGHAKTGCYYVSQSLLREDGSWSPPYIAQGHDAFKSSGDIDLHKLFEETDGEVCPHYAAAKAREAAVRATIQVVG